jgi:hypothetical protein
VRKSLVILLSWCAVALVASWVFHDAFWKMVDKPPPPLPGNWSPSPEVAKAKEFDLNSAHFLVLDLTGHGIETIGVQEGPNFDHDGNGFAEQTAWVSADNGILVWDRNGDGEINNGKELFGGYTFLKDGNLAKTSYQALAELDANGDGQIDEKDSAYSQLRVWQNGGERGYLGSSVSEGGIRTLSELGITAIQTSYTPSKFIDSNGNQHRQVGTYKRTDGSIGVTADIWFKVDRMFGIAIEWLEVPEDIRSLPDVQGWGTLYSLHQAMVRDTSGTLKRLVERFAAEKDPFARTALMDELLFAWAGSTCIDRNSRGQYIDARKLAFAEKFTGTPFYSVYVGSYPGPGSAPYVDQSYQGFSELVYAQLMAQTHLRDLYLLMKFRFDDSAQKLNQDLSGVREELLKRISSDPAAGKVLLGEFVRTLHGYHSLNNVNFEEFKNAFVSQDHALARVIESAATYTPPRQKVPQSCAETVLPESSKTR